MTLAVVALQERDFVIAAEGGALVWAAVAQARKSEEAAELAAENAQASAAAAEAAAGPTYPDTAAGLAATSDGDAFAVDNGDGTVTIWLNAGGVAVEQRELLTTAYAASGAGASAIGLPQGGKVSDALKCITPEMYGAAADGATDDLSAIDAAVAAVASIPGTYLLLNRASYAASDTVDLTAAKVVYSDSAIIVPLHDGIGVQIVSPAGVPYAGRRIEGMLTVQWPSVDWTKDRKAFFIQNSYSGTFNLSAVRATIALQMHSNGTGCAYNLVNIGEFNGNSVGVYLTSETSVGWTNANEFRGGRFNGSGDPSAGLYGSVSGHIVIDDSLYNHNGNRFVDNSLEWIGPNFRLARMGGGYNSLSPKYCELRDGDLTWITDTGTENFIDCAGVPYISLGYDPSIGPAQRLDASGATYPTITGRSATYITQAQTKYFQTTSPTVPAIRARNTSTGLAIEARSGTSPSNQALGVTHSDGTLGCAFAATGRWLVKRNTTETILRHVDWNIGNNAPPTDGGWRVGDISYQNSVSRSFPVVYDVCISAGTPGDWRAGAWIVGRGTTAQRPTLGAGDIGVMYMDSTLAAAGKPIWWTGTAWVDATGTTV